VPHNDYKKGKLLSHNAHWQGTSHELYSMIQELEEKVKKLEKKWKRKTKKGYFRN